MKALLFFRLRLMREFREQPLPNIAVESIERVTIYYCFLSKLVRHDYAQSYRVVIYSGQSLVDVKVTHIFGIEQIFVDNQTTCFGAWAVLFQIIL